MRIKYFTNEETGATLAKTFYDEPNGGYIEGIDTLVAFVLEDEGIIKRKGFKRGNPMSSWAKAYDGVDVPDPETGKKVARDKVLVKYYASVGEKYREFADAIREYAERYDQMAKTCADKSEAAKERLETYNGIK